MLLNFLLEIILFTGKVKAIIILTIQISAILSCVIILLLFLNRKINSGISYHLTVLFTTH